MAYRSASQKILKVMIQPINVIFRHLQNRTRVSIWLYERTNLKIEGVVIGFDEFMNIVLDDAEEVSGFNKKDGEKPKRRPIGRILLKGDTVCLMHPILNQTPAPSVVPSIGMPDA